MSALTDTEIEMLDFASGWWKYAGAKDEEIRQRFDVPAIRYYQQLNALIDRPEAMAARPQVVKRLRPDQSPPARTHRRDLPARGDGTITGQAARYSATPI